MSRAYRKKTKVIYKAKKPLFSIKHLLAIVFILVVAGIFSFTDLKKLDFISFHNLIYQAPKPKPPIIAEAKTINSKLKPTPTPTPTPSPTPEQISFDQLNTQFGPCVTVPILMYHHIQDGIVAAKGNYQSLNVDPGTFRLQMEYIKNNYVTITFSQLAAFFDNNTMLPAKPIIITFDDGYVDLYVNALPIMRDLGLHATVFTITGLNNNPAYLTWDQISEMAGSGLFIFGNHTWSHHNLIASEAIISSEIDTAQNQLIEKGLNNEKIFAYPYGAYSDFTIKYLQTQGYSEAVTTNYGTIQCKSHRLTLSRIRIGNGALSAYGL